MIGLATEKVIAKFVRVSSKVGVAEANKNSSWALLNFLLAAKIHKYEFSLSVPSKYLSIAVPSKYLSIAVPSKYLSISFRNALKLGGKIRELRGKIVRLEDEMHAYRG